MSVPKPPNALVEDMAADTLAGCHDVLDALLEIESREATAGRNEILKCVMSALDYEIGRENERRKGSFTLDVAGGAGGGVMQYSYYEDFDFHRNGLANRRDADAIPRVLLIRMDEIHNEVHFHFAGDACIRTGLVLDATSDDDLVSGMAPHDALRLGIEYQRVKQNGEGVANE